MGMIGYYIAIDNDTLQAIQTEELNIYEVDSSLMLDIDKSWQIIHYVFCDDIDDGEPPMGYVVPLNFVNNLEIEDTHYGAFLLTPDLVKQGYEYMKDIDLNQFKEKYNFEELKEEEIYPLSRDAELDEADFFEYIFDFFEEIKTFYKKAIEKEDNIIFYII